MALIPLTRGLFATVDDADAEWLGQWKWCADPVSAPCGKFRAVRSERAGVTRILMHRLILGAARGHIVDHIDADSLNNSRNNLRICSTAENSYNRRVHSNNKIGLKGVSYSQWRFRSVIRVNGKQHFLGRFSTAHEAAAAYDAAAIRLHGEFARLNGV